MRTIKKILTGLLILWCMGNLCLADETLDAVAGLPLTGSNWQLVPLYKRLLEKKIYLQPSPGRHSAFLNGKKIFGETCMEIAVVTDRQNRMISSIDLTFANKGDVAKRSGSAIRQTVRKLTTVLTNNFGKPEKETLGPDTRKFRRDVSVWYSGDAAILLESERGEYVIVHIRPREKAQPSSDGKPAENLAANVRRNDFGDVFICNIPMVDQGGKGYCVVATAARVVLYFGIKDAGMHLLADAAKSDADGGTTLAGLFKALKPLRRKYGLKQKNLGEVSIKAVKPYIDSGIPVFWTMFALPEYELIRRGNLKKRAKCDSPEEWVKILKKQDTVKSARKNPHLCLIVGYNEVTREIAVSNSWGVSENIPSWVSEKNARKVCQKYTFVILP